MPAQAFPRQRFQATFLSTENPAASTLTDPFTPLHEDDGPKSGHVFIS